MSINSLSSAQLKKQQEVNNFLSYLDGVQTGKYDFRNEEIAMLNSDGVAGLSNAEITTVKTRLTNLATNISTYFNEDGTTKAAYDLDNDGNTADDIQALGYIVNGRSQPNNSLRLKNNDEALSTGLKHQFVTKGGYRVSYEGTTTYIHDTQGKNLAVVHGDPHVDERNTGAQWHFGADSTFILPDGTKILFDTVGSEESGVYVTQGLIIDDGSKIMYAGRVEVGGKAFTAYDTATEVNSTTLGADAALFTDENLNDRSSLQHAGVFVYSEDANTNRGGWAIKTAEGVFEDVKAEAWGDYLSANGKSFAGQVEGTVQVSREARIATLDGANAAQAKALITKGSSLAVVDAFLDLVSTNNSQALTNFQKLVDGNYSEATIKAYTASANSPFTNPYDNMLNGGVSKDVIEALATIPNLGDSSKLTYSIISNIRKDLSVDALKSFVNVHKNAIDGTGSFEAYQSINTAINSNNIDSADVINFANFANKHKAIGTAGYDAYVDLLKTNKSALALSIYDSLLTNGASNATRSAFTTLLEGNASDKVLTAFSRLTNDTQVNAFLFIYNKPASTATKEAWLEEFTDYSTSNATDKLTVLNDLINLNYAGSRAFIANSANLNRALTVHGLANNTTVLPMLLILNDAGVNDATKDRLVTLAQTGASTTKLNAFTVTNARKQASEITALNTYLSLNASDAFLQSFTDLITGTNDTSTAKVGIANSLVGLKETIGARIYPAVETGDIKFSKHADIEMIKLMDAMVATILSNSSAHLSNPDAMNRVKAELAKLNQNNINSKEQYIAVLTASSVLNSGLTNIDARVANIRSTVDSDYNRYVPNGGGGGTTPPPVTPTDRVTVRIQSRISSYTARKESYQRLLDAIPANSTDRREISRRNSYLNRIASLVSQIASLQAQLDARTTA